MKQCIKFQPLKTLGDQPIPTPDEVRCSVRLACSMYGKDCLSLNELQCERVENGATIGKRLPPTNDSFKLHLLRAVYQLIMWKQAVVAMPDLLAENFGYEQVRGILQPILMTQNIAAPELLNNLICSCVDQCLADCSCSMNNQPCTAACSCSSKQADIDDDQPIRCHNLHHDDDGDGNEN